MRRLIRNVVSALAAALVAVPLVHAVSVQTIANPVPNGAIKIDGNISDWLGVTKYTQDAIGDGSSGPARPLDIDILQGAVAHDANFFYFLYRNTADGMVDGASNWIFIDLDRNQATGQNAIPGTTAIGMEFNLGGTGGWNAWSPTGPFAGPAAGRTVAAGDSDNSGGADFLEYAVSRTAAQPNGITFNPIGGSLFDLLFAAEDTILDNHPNNGDQDFFTYDASGIYNPGVPGDANNSGTVTMADYLLIQANSFTAQPFGTNGDVDDSGFVDFADFQQWKTNFPGGVAAAEAALAALPEPSSAVLLVAAAMGLAARQRMKRA
jgi:hypothetical protein